ncbi:hypothetical protein DVH05_019185 [Phytophthora capsici]|nr:hypothetical protein DVH05_019185 [Phytophthora capsici]
MDQDPVPLIEDVLILPEVQEILESSSERGGISAVDAWERNARKDEEKAHENQGSDNRNSRFKPLGIDNSGKLRIRLQYLSPSNW